MQARPIFHEHEDDHLIPPGYGIDESHDGGFYPYIIVGDDHDDMEIHSDSTQILYLHDANGLDIRKETYEQAREHLAEVAD
jgi:hypothetical protein